MAARLQSPMLAHKKLSCAGEVRNPRSPSFMDLLFLARGRCRGGGRARQLRGAPVALRISDFGFRISSPHEKPTHPPIQ